MVLLAGATLYLFLFGEELLERVVGSSWRSNRLDGGLGDWLWLGLRHDFLLDLRGAERVFEELCALYPHADVFTAVYDERGTEGRFTERGVQATFLQALRPTSRTCSGATDPGSPSSGLRRPPPAVTMRLGRAWPEVSPTAMAASREIFSSAEVL